MKLYIPEIGDRIRLLSDWTFDLMNESRNSTLMEFIGDQRKPPMWPTRITGAPCTIPAGTLLKIDRLYIRKGMEDFSSVTFLWEGARTTSRTEDRPITRASSVPTRSLIDLLSRKPAPAIGPGVTTIIKVKKAARPVRFWAKLKDVNNIEFEQV